jgi:hypothetical protein
MAGSMKHQAALLLRRLGGGAGCTGFGPNAPGSVLLRSGGFQVSLLDRDRFLADQGARFTRGNSKI